MRNADRAVRWPTARTGPVHRIASHTNQLKPQGVSVKQRARRIGAAIAASVFASIGSRPVGAAQADWRPPQATPNGLWSQGPWWFPAGVPNNGGGFTYDVTVQRGVVQVNMSPTV